MSEQQHAQSFDDWAVQTLGFSIDLDECRDMTSAKQRARISVIRYREGGCHPANTDEIALWNALRAAAPFDLEHMLRDCVPGGGIVDPQLVCDNIRAWFAERGSCHADQA